ncbi:MAG: coniferyl aldehyde dehydrogenase [Francisellaceae bacterium]
MMKLDTIFSHYQDRYRHDPYPFYKTRIRLLQDLKKMLLCEKGALCEAVSRDFGHRADEETLMLELFPLIKSIDYVLKQLKDWMKPRRRKVTLIFQPAKNYVYYQPKGVIGIVVPWNYPLFLAFSPLIYSLAAGNRSLIKCSEYSPHVATLLDKLCKQYFSDWVAIIAGDVKVADAFSRLPFNHLLFTGSTAIGKKVMAAASENLTPVTLELGGKSPTVIDEHYPLDKAARVISFAKSINSGQTCIAPDYVLLPRHRLQGFVEQMDKQFRRLYPDFSHNHQYSQIITDEQFERLQTYLTEAKECALNIVPLEKTADGKKAALTLVMNPSDDSGLMRDEIFGFILPVITYDAIEEVFDRINAQDRPLALYAFTSDKQLQRRLLNETHSGGVCFNDAIMHVAQSDLPFGGVGASGMGRYHGREGFETFSNIKSVFQRGRFNSATLLYPPYGKFFSWFLRIFLR